MECDPSIKAIIKKIDEDNNNAFIIVDLDDEHLLIQSDKHDQLKALLKEVCPTIYMIVFPQDTDMRLETQGHCS